MKPAPHLHELLHIISLDTDDDSSKINFLLSCISVGVAAQISPAERAVAALRSTAVA